MSAERTQQRLPAWMPMACVIFGTLVVLAFAHNLSAQKTGGLLMYALDDAYIHLSIARNLHVHGVWGISADHASSASSSPLWIAILWLFQFLPLDPTIIPLIVNLILGAVLAVVVFNSVKSLSPWVRCGAALLLVFGLPGVAIFLGGMENLLHALLTALYIVFLLNTPRTALAAKPIAAALALGFFMQLTRYESVFVFAVPTLWGIYRRQWILVMPMIGAVLGVVFFGLLSVRAGMPFIPNTILLKSDAATGSGFLRALWIRVRLNVAMETSFTYLALVATTIFAFATQWKSSPATRLAAASVIVAMLLHDFFAYTGQLSRYEAYLVCAAGVTMLYGVSQARSRQLLEQIALTLFGLTLVARIGVSFVQAPGGTQNVCDQQYQMARFVSTFYAGKNVALNDIGLVSYYGNANVIDLYGLASDDVRKLKQANQFDTAAITNILNENHADAVIVYYGWFDKYGGLPSLDVLPAAGLWAMHEPNYVCAGDHVAFLAPPDKVKRLQAAMAVFQKDLPPTDEAQYFNLKTELNSPASAKP